jgi:hypothetical protein
MIVRGDSPTKAGFADLDDAEREGKRLGFGCGGRLARLFSAKFLVARGTLLLAESCPIR